MTLCAGLSERQKQANKSRVLTRRGETSAASVGASEVQIPRLKGLNND